MSRGLGKVELAIVGFLKHVPDGRGLVADTLARLVYDTEQPTAAHIAAVRRALGTLMRKGFVTGTKVGKQTLWATLRVRRQKRNKQESEPREDQFDWSSDDFADIQSLFPKPDKRVERIAALLGMIGSFSDGEALNSARHAERIRSEMGVSWAELLNVRQAL